ncbi:peptide chain release factor N(5)-glutamine methyltransferase [Legionella dresdenensis]|uniref:Release factor glutamine methyltransferase n=1 Tax=Legionella dresdenensis TaxID=450200 RepID=A0ABV8CGQ5_9GAMM
MIEIKSALEHAARQLEPYSDTARIDAEILLAHILLKTRTWLYTYPEYQLTTQQIQTFESLVARRSLGTPIAYLTGTREFWSLPLRVNQETLIPRPETELLVELTLSMVSPDAGARILDLGTGSGAIALALAKERPEWDITACDLSESALQTAQDNARLLGINNIRFCRSNWFSNLEISAPFDAIVSNPPYIAANDPHLTIGDVRFEPTHALISGNDGLSDIRHIIEHSLASLVKGGLLLIEHGYQQKLSVTSMLKEYGYVDIASWKDWQNNDRVSGGRSNY